MLPFVAIFDQKPGDHGCTRSPGKHTRTRTIGKPAGLVFLLWPKTDCINERTHVYSLNLVNFDCNDVCNYYIFVCGCYFLCLPRTLRFFFISLPFKCLFFMCWRAKKVAAHILSVVKLLHNDVMIDVNAIFTINYYKRRCL